MSGRKVPRAAVTVRPFEVLHRAAEGLMATVCLTSDRDVRVSAGRRPLTDQRGSQLKRLVVVRPAVGRELSRWEQLRDGDVLAASNIPAGMALDDVANLLLLQLRMAARGRS